MKVGNLTSETEKTVKIPVKVYKIYHDVHGTSQGVSVVEVVNKVTGPVSVHSLNLLHLKRKLDQKAATSSQVAEQKTSLTFSKSPLCFSKSCAVSNHINEQYVPQQQRW